MQTIADPRSISLGSPLPPGDIHAVGVHLPEWRDTLGWAAREGRVVDAMKTGYPRFFVPRVVDKLAERIVELGLAPKSNNHPSKDTSQKQNYRAILFPSKRYVDFYIDFLRRQAPPGTNLDQVYALMLKWEGTIANLDLKKTDQSISRRCSDGYRDNQLKQRPIYAVLYPASLHPLTKAFWQHTGFGISSRHATYWLESADMFTTSNRGASKSFHERPRRGRSYRSAKESITSAVKSGQSPEHVTSVADEHIQLYPTGMTAITEAAVAVKALQTTVGRQCTAAVFGFTYVDTYKTITRVLDFEATLYKYADADEVERQLNQGLKLDLLITEFPGNPLLQSPDMTRLHELAKKHDFILIVDDTVGTCINVNLMQYCDVVCTSLTKMFSGRCNVMGGAVVVSPHSRHQDELLTALSKVYEEIWFPEDVSVMEENSRDFGERVRRANSNAEFVVSLLQHSLAIGEVYYPKGSTTQHIYDRFRLPDGGYGFLLSIKFTSPARAIAFYDNLDVAKGPSLGTNFTLCCAYTLLAHFSELQWAAEYGVVEHLVRISVGLEDEEWLRARIDKALRAAETVQD
ncbi:putative cystathionine gamma-synthase/beta-lyase [Rhypophila sp. PSN 637]